MSKPNKYQAAILASQLRSKGYESAENVPLEVWRSLGFLNVPTLCLQKAISEFLADTAV